MKSVKYLEMAKEASGMKNDAELALRLGRTKAAISQYRSGKNIMDNETCVALAMEIGIDPIKIIMAADMDRAERAGQKSLWEVFSQRTATAASALLIAVVTLFLTPQNEAAASNALRAATSMEYKLCEIARWVKTVLAKAWRVLVMPTLEPAAG